MQEGQNMGDVWESFPKGELEKKIWSFFHIQCLKVKYNIDPLSVEVAKSAMELKFIEMMYKYMVNRSPSDFVSYQVKFAVPN